MTYATSYYPGDTSLPKYYNADKPSCFFCISAVHQSYFNVKFFHKLTFISISAYFKLLPGERGYSPNFEWTKREWKKRADQVVAWRRKNNLQQPVLIAEVGIQSKGKFYQLLILLVKVRPSRKLTPVFFFFSFKGDGVVYRVPWQWNVGAPLNYHEQVKMYEGILGAFMPRKWCVGVMLWHWELDPEAGKYGATLTGYTPQNKPALKVMKKFYKRNYKE